MVKIIFTRHGETLWNIEGRVQGALDSALTEKGIRQARRLGERLQNEGITRIYSSDLPRAKATAEEVRQILGLNEVLTEPALRELSFGEWEGQKWWDLREQYPELFALWDSGPHKVQIPGGENMWDVTTRAWNFVNKLPQLHAGETICVVTHGITLQCIVKKALGIPVEQWQDVPWQHNTAVNIFEFYEDGLIKPILIADHSHLDGLIQPASGFTKEKKEA